MHDVMASSSSSSNSNLLSEKSQFSAKVSSVLNKNVKEFGKKFLFDNREDTCWNSDQGTPQFISLTFDSVIKTISQLQIQFQGGFVGKSCQLIVNNNDETPPVSFHPEDSNKLQTFHIDFQNVQTLKIVFNDSTDFFGRITIYQLKLLPWIDFQTLSFMYTVEFEGFVTSRSPSQTHCYYNTD